VELREVCGTAIVNGDWKEAAGELSASEYGKEKHPKFQ